MRQSYKARDGYEFCLNPGPSEMNLQVLTNDLLIFYFGLNCRFDRLISTTFIEMLNKRLNRIKSDQVVICRIKSVSVASSR